MSQPVDECRTCGEYLNRTRVIERASGCCEWCARPEKLRGLEPHDPREPQRDPSEGV